jgi:hypothetical protein
MTPQSLNCPNCAGPLQLKAGQSRTLCIYCGSVIYVAANTSTPEVTSELPADVHTQLKQLLIEGRRPEAVSFYRDRTGASEAEAQETLNNLGQSLTRRALFEQPVSNGGLLLFIAVDGLSLAAMGWGLLNGNWIVVAIALAIFLFETATFSKAIYMRFLEEFGTAGEATIRKVVKLGELKLRGEPDPIQMVRLWLEVHPPDLPAFQAEKTVAMRVQSFEKIKPGLVIAVKYNRNGQVFPSTPMKIISTSNA